MSTADTLFLLLTERILRLRPAAFIQPERACRPRFRCRPLRFDSLPLKVARIFNSGATAFPPPLSGCVLLLNRSSSPPSGLPTFHAYVCIRRNLECSVVALATANVLRTAAEGVRSV